MYDKAEAEVEIQTWVWVHQAQAGLHHQMLATPAVALAVMAAAAGAVVGVIRTHRQRAEVAQSASFGPAISANSPQHAQQTNKDQSWNTHS